MINEGGGLREALGIRGRDFTGVKGCGCHGCVIESSVLHFTEKSEGSLYLLVVDGGHNRFETIDESVNNQDLTNIMNRIKENSKMGFKHMQSRKVFRYYNPKKDFIEEVNSVKNIANMLGIEFIKNNTMIPLLEHGTDRYIIGMKVTKSTVNDYIGDNYLVLQTICSMNMFKYFKKSIDYEQLRNALVDVLRTVKQLQDKKIVHTDIKSDNIVLCENRFYLIDWGRMHVYDDLHTNISKFNNNPVSIHANTNRAWKKILTNDTVVKLMDRYRGIRVSKNTKYNIWFDGLSDKFREQSEKLSRATNRIDFVSTHWKKIDLFCVGVAILQIVSRFPMDDRSLNVLGWVEKLMTFPEKYGDSYEKPWESAEEALAELEIPDNENEEKELHGGASRGVSRGVSRIACMTAITIISAIFPRP